MNYSIIFYYVILEIFIYLQILFRTRLITIRQIIRML